MDTLAHMPGDQGTPRLFEALQAGPTFTVVDAQTLDAHGEVTTIPPSSQADTDVAIGWTPGIGAHQWRVYNKTPSRRVSPLQRRMQKAALSTATALGTHGLCLLPGGLHPWMPAKANAINGDHAELADRTLGLRTYGPAPGQYTGLTISFRGDAEFTKLFAATRLLLPIIPALTAASPFVNGRANGILCNRLHAWRMAEERLPGLRTPIIPEAVFTEEDHYRSIQTPMAQALAEAGALELLSHELADLRGAVAVFDPGRIHIRMADTQESVLASLAVTEMIVAVLRALVKGRWVSSYLQRAWHEHDLQQVLEPVIREADEAVIADRNYPVMFGLLDQEGITAGKLWQHLFVELYGDLSEVTRTHITHVLEHGCLARRILRRTGPEPDPAVLRSVYSELADHVAAASPFA